MPPVETYSFGEITVDGKRYTRDLIVFPDRVMDNWWRRTGHEVCLADIETIVEAAPEVAIFGTGAMGRMSVLPESVRALEAEGCQVLVQPTKRAYGEYNRLREEGRNVVLALHLTC